MKTYRDMELPQAPQKKNTGAKVTLLVVVLFLAVGGGLVYRFAQKPAPPPEPTLTPEPTPTETPEPSPIIIEEDPLNPSVIKKIAGIIKAVNINERSLTVSATQPKKTEYKVLVTADTLIRPVIIPNKFNRAPSGTLDQIRAGDFAEITTVEAIDEHTPKTINAAIIQAIRP